MRMHWPAGHREVQKFRDHLEERFQTTITEEKLRAAADLMNRERKCRRDLADLMTRESPPLTGRQLIEFKSIVSGLEADLEQYERALQQFGAQSSVLSGTKRPASPGTVDGRSIGAWGGAGVGIDRERGRGRGRHGRTAPA